MRRIPPVRATACCRRCRRDEKHRINLLTRLDPSASDWAGTPRSGSLLNVQESFPLGFPTANKLLVVCQTLSGVPHIPHPGVWPTWQPISAALLPCTLHRHVLHTNSVLSTKAAATLLPSGVRWQKVQGEAKTPCGCAQGQQKQQKVEKRSFVLDQRHAWHSTHHTALRPPGRQSGQMQLLLLEGFFFWRVAGCLRSQPQTNTMPRLIWQQA